jgi:hypothetical protein
MFLFITGEEAKKLEHLPFETLFHPCKTFAAPEDMYR